MKVRNPLRKRWEVVIVGKHSSHETPVTFMRTRRRAKAQYWAFRNNLKTEQHGLIRYEVREL